MLESAIKWVRALNYPLRSAGHAARWVGQLPGHDALAIQQTALDLVSAFPGPIHQIGPAQAEALLRIDSRLEPIIAQLTQQYTTTYQKSSAIESRLWHAVFDLVKAFIAAYQETLKAGYPRADNRRWRAVLPWVLVRLAYYKGLDGKYRLFRYSRWIPAQWREFHELYEFARMRGWQREQLLFGVGAFSRPGISLEQEYLKALLLMRLDSGNFTPDQVEWVARQLQDWAPSLTLVPPPGEGATFFVDLTGAQGLRRRERPNTAGRVLMLDTGPIYGRVVERLRWLPERDEDTHEPGDLPAREQRLLLMRLASLFGPEAIAKAPRAERFRTDGEVHVVVGLPSLGRAVAEVDRLPDASRSAGQAGIDGDGTQAVEAAVDADSVTRQIQGSTWRIVDRSETGCRLVAPSKDAPTVLGELIGLRDGDQWAIAIVRRMQRHQVDEVTVGAEIIARRIVRVLMHSWMAPTGEELDGADRPFFALYLPVHGDNRQSAQRSLIGPDDRFPAGGMVELDTGNGRYLIRFTQTLERQAGWAWALFSAVRKLSA